MTGWIPSWVRVNPTKCAFGGCNKERHYIEETDKVRRYCAFHSAEYDRLAADSDHKLIRIN